MSRLADRLARLGTPGVLPLAPFLTFGDGGADVTLAALSALDERGACCVELGVPFSDPIADGPVLQRASERALAGGATLAAALACVAELRRTSELPVVLMSYLNPLLAHGLEATLAHAAAAGVDGLIVPDLPLEEARALVPSVRAAGLDPILLVAPTSSDERIEESAALSSGFLYAIGRVGVTGAETRIDPATRDYLARVRRIVRRTARSDAGNARPLPVAVGFGIRTRAQMAAVLEEAELAIVGSAFVEALHRAVATAPADRADAARRAAHAFVDELAEGAA